VSLLACLSVVALLSFVTYEPRLHQRFPSMVDDWNAIASAPQQLQKVVAFHNPEGGRYRPGFVLWSVLQWHTLGAPTTFTGPQLWGLARLAILVLGVTLLAALLIAPPRSWGFPPDPRWLLTLGIPLSTLTVPATAVDIARFGPQEPLMVGCISIGAVMMVRSLDTMLDVHRKVLGSLLTAVAGVVIWAFGIAQKESSLCLLVLAPFLLPTILGQAARWANISSRRRRAIAAIGIGAFLAFIPMLFRTLQLATSGTRVYQEIAAQQSFTNRLAEQFLEAGGSLQTPFFALLTVAVVVVTLVTIHRRGTDWLAVGLIATALAFIGFAAEAGVVASRYYLPVIALLALALGRGAAALGTRAAIATSALLLLFGSLHAVLARHSTDRWVVDERSQEELVRQSASRHSAGCSISVTGSNVELVAALPVLMPLARATSRGCEKNERFLVVIDWAYGPTTSQDRSLVACGSAQVVWSNRIGRILRCST
jgi:hypothetical protein